MESVEERHGMTEVMSVMPGMQGRTHRTNAGMITAMAMMPAAIGAIAVSAIGTEAVTSTGTIALPTLRTVLSAFGTITLAALRTVLSTALMAVVSGSATILISTLRTYGLRLCLTRTVALRLTAAGIGCN